jgi:hypothetical protein
MMKGPTYSAELAEIAENLIVYQFASSPPGTPRKTLYVLLGDLGDLGGSS